MMIPSKFILLITTFTTLISIITTTNAATLINIRNNCPFTIWPASFPAGGGRRLESGQSWTVNFPLGTSGGLIWARTGCTFDRSGTGRCETGDCNGLLECRGHGSPPTTLVDIATSLTVQNLDFFDVSLVKGFNLPVEFRPVSGNCTRGPRCAGPGSDVAGRCPGPLRTSGGCNDACTVFKTDEYCCTGEAACGPTEYSRFFKGECSEALSYPIDGEGTAFGCPSGTDYRVVFCP